MPEEFFACGRECWGIDRAGLFEVKALDSGIGLGAVEEELGSCAGLEVWKQGGEGQGRWCS